MNNDSDGVTVVAEAPLTEQKAYWHRFKLEGGQSELEQKQQDLIVKIPSSLLQLERQILHKCNDDVKNGNLRISACWLRVSLPMFWRI